MWRPSGLVHAALAVSDEAWDAYDEWSAQLAAEMELESENFTVAASVNLHHKPEPKSCGRVGGFEL